MSPSTSRLQTDANIRVSLPSPAFKLGIKLQIPYIVAWYTFLLKGHKSVGSLSVDIGALFVSPRSWSRCPTCALGGIYIEAIQSSLPCHLTCDNFDAWNRGEVNTIERIWGVSIKANNIKIMEVEINI